MSIDTNAIIITGNLTKDADVRKVGDVDKGRFTIAVNRGKDDKGNRRSAYFFTVDCWSHSARFARDYLRKGDRVLIEGRIEHQTWIDKKTEENRSAVVIVANRIDKLSYRKDTER